MRSDPQYIRYHVFRRDHGICRSCGRDCGAIDREGALKRRHITVPWRRSGREWSREVEYRYARFWRSHFERKREALVKEGFTARISAWQADHIIEVADGGAELGLENYQTLCVPCHKGKSARSAAARSLDREIATSIQRITKAP